ncbi:HAD-IA family hydrolase [Muricauda sp. SCSIO 64092]|uniref:HAD family hydrolase n=1 Tax=Allomuricauda sp. SCSIO 64092 TaxID=2908842 RepID=UPI001FF54F52|nr:HAD-IA family hydrolase [Muricauda sp. SCSIO 64092]UOY08267.1 HAD-IA family hydrolase [Muricauda sp. SCSIO 64092]
MKKIKAVIFDLDGTIGNTLPLCVKAFRNAIEPLIDRKVTDSEIIATFGPSEEGTILALAPNHYEKGIKDYLLFYEKFHEMCPAPFDGIRNILDFLQHKNVRLAMVTGKGKHSTRISLKKFDLDSYFEIIETGKSTGPRKPEGIGNIINEFVDIHKQEMVYVGDSPNDILDCREVEIPVIGAAWAETTDVEKLEILNPDEIFYTVADFRKWLMLNV